MTVALQASLDAKIDPPRADVLIVGGGPVGIRLGQQLAQQGQSVVVLGDENHDPYNRVRLTPLLSGDVQFGEIELPYTPGLKDRLNVHVGARVVRINRQARSVTTADGVIWPFETLVRP